MGEDLKFENFHSKLYKLSLLPVSAFFIITLLIQLFSKAPQDSLFRELDQLLKDRNPSNISTEFFQIYSFIFQKLTKILSDNMDKLAVVKLNDQIIFNRDTTINLSLEELVSTLAQNWPYYYLNPSPLLTLIFQTNYINSNGESYTVSSQIVIHLKTIGDYKSNESIKDIMLEQLFIVESSIDNQSYELSRWVEYFNDGYPVNDFLTRFYSSDSLNKIINAPPEQIAKFDPIIQDIIDRSLLPYIN